MASEDPGASATRGTTWPPVAWEERRWVSRLGPGIAPRRIRERHSGPYQAAVVPLIADLDVVLPSEVTGLAEEAATEIARFDAELGADIAPFRAILLRSESAASSRIERLTASARAIALAELGDQDRRNATEIVANTRAMQAAIDLADQLDSDAILEMHAALMDGEGDIGGRWRDEQVWIGGSDYGPHGADFVPPHHDHVPALIEDLVRFMRRDDLPTMVQAAIAHAQFETIHPFPDGNGRTGRALVHSLMRAKGLSRQVTIPVSAGLLTDTTGYFATLDDYRRGESTRIVVLLAEATFTAIANGRRLIGDLREIRDRWNGLIGARRDAAAWRLSDLLLRQPALDAELASRELGTASGNTHRAIRQLVEAGILTEFSGRRRNQRWLAAEVLSALDDFAARAGRRQRVNDRG